MGGGTPKSSSGHNLIKLSLLRSDHTRMFLGCITSAETVLIEQQSNKQLYKIFRNFYTINFKIFTSNHPIQEKQNTNKYEAHIEKSHAAVGDPFCNVHHQPKIIVSPPPLPFTESQSFVSQFCPSPPKTVNFYQWSNHRIVGLFSIYDGRIVCF